MIPGFKKYKSPQTGSTYEVVGEFKDIILAYRKDGHSRRIRIQVNKSEHTPYPKDTLTVLKQLLKKGDKWSEIKGEYHISITTSKHDFKGALLDAYSAIITRFGII